MATAEEIYGLDLAFSNDYQVSASGDMQTISGQNNIREALIRRTVTQPGSLIHRPDYGVGIKDFLNALNSLDNQRELANRIKVQWEQDPRVVEVIGVRLLIEDDTPEKIEIGVRVNLVGLGEVSLRLIPLQERVT